MSTASGGPRVGVPDGVGTDLFVLTLDTILCGGVGGDPDGPMVMMFYSPILDDLNFLLIINRIKFWA
tara:strand:- start:34 stop:234 length:201 start_codon:yes stop_codon:yes gene_type:complete